MSDFLPAGVPPLEPGAPPIDYEAALERVMGLADFERSTRAPQHWSFHLERMSLLLERLGNPHLGIPTVHVAGTKGKGSTAAMVSSVLTAQGYRTGLYTSPHLHRAVERIRVGLDPVTGEQFAGLVEQTWPAVQWVGEHGEYGGVTTFEMLTAMAFVHFRQIGADFQVIEVGLGGRLDSTNVVRPEVCAITSISLDHTATLGDTVELIAAEKAGIIKPRVPIVVAPQVEEAMAVFRRVAEERQAPLVDVAASISCTPVHADLDGQSFQVGGLRGRYDLWMPLLGDYQLENAGAVVAVAETLAGRGFTVSAQSIVEGLRQVRWPARFQVLSREGPALVVDGAHNPYSMKRLVHALRSYFDFQRVLAIFGGLSGHSASGMLAELAELAPQVAAVRSRHPRSAPSAIIAEAVAHQGLPLLLVSEDIAGATRRVLEIAGEGDLVVATGSLSVAAEVIEAVEGIPPELYPNIKRPSWRPQSRVRA